MEREVGKNFEVKGELRQGYVMLALLFKTYFNKMVKEVNGRNGRGFEFGG